MTLDTKELIERLRDAERDYAVEWATGELHETAADELERLTQALAESARQIAAIANWHCETDGCAADHDIEKIGREFGRALYARVAEAEEENKRLKAELSNAYGVPVYGPMQST